MDDNLFEKSQGAKHGSRFGSGLYFAEDLGKSLTYAAGLKR